MRTTIAAAALIALLATSARADEAEYEGKPASYWAEALRSLDIQIRSKAMNAIRAIGKPAIPHLLREMKKENGFRWCCGALGEIGEDAVDAVPEILPYLVSKETAERDTAMQVIVKIGPKSIPTLLKAFDKTRSRDLKIALAKTFGSFQRQGEPAGEALCEELGGKDEEYEKACATALKRIGMPVLPLLLKYAGEGKTKVRISAIGVIGAIGLEARETAEPALRGMLEKERKTSIKAAIESALAQMGAG